MGWLHERPKPHFELWCWGIPGEIPHRSRGAVTEKFHSVDIALTLVAPFATLNINMSSSLIASMFTTTFQTAGGLGLAILGISIAACLMWKAIGERLETVQVRTK